MNRSLCISGTALLALALFPGFFFSSCKQDQRAQPGYVEYQHKEWHDTGQPKSETRVSFRQNEDAESPSRIVIEVQPPKVEADLGTSFFRELPIDLSAERMALVGAGILLIIGAGFLLWKGILHCRKQAAITALSGLALIAIAFTAERYAWAYAAGVIGAAALIAAPFIYQNFKRLRSRDS